MKKPLGPFLSTVEFECAQERHGSLHRVFKKEKSKEELDPSWNPIVEPKINNQITEKQDRLQNKRVQVIVAVFSIPLLCVLGYLLCKTGFFSFNGNPEFGIEGYQVANNFTAGWFDSDGGRPGYTIDEVNAGALGEAVTLNSITDGKIGNEFNFVGAVDGTTLRDENIWHSDTIEVKEGYVYYVRIYLENSATYSSAEGVEVRFDICDTLWASEANLSGPDASNDSGGSYVAAVHGYIQGANTSPEIVGDSVIFVSERPFHLEYKYGTAVLENTGIGSGDGCSLPDDIVKTWISIGYDQLNGILPAGYEYDGECIITVEPVFDDKQKNTFDTLLVRKSNGGDWEKEVELKEGDVIELQYHFVNYETVMWDNISLHATLPEGINFISGSTEVFEEDNLDGVKVETDDIVENGLFISREKPVVEAYVRFQAVVGDLTDDKDIFVESRMPGEFVDDTVRLILIDPNS